MPNRKPSSKERIVQFAIKAVPVLAFILLWQFVSSSEIINSRLFPPPTEVVKALQIWITSGMWWVDVKASIWRVFTGLFIGSLLGIAIGLLTGRYKRINLTVVPLIQIFRPLPPVAIIPLVIVWLGIDDPAKIFSIAFAIFFPVWINTHIGAAGIPKNYLRSASLLTHSRWQIFASVLFPAALPSIISGLRTAIPVAFVMVYVSEIAGASEGLGYRISVSQLAYRIDSMMAGLFVLALAGALTDLLFTFLTGKMFPWTKLV